MYQRTSIYLAISGFTCIVLLSFPVNAQLMRGRCRCEDFPLFQSGYLDSEKKAIELVNEMLTKIKQYGHIRFNQTIQVKETDCPIPSALLCGIKLNGRVLREERLIIYNNDYLKRISKEKGIQTWIDWHVLAHEIGHHVLGHLDTGKPFIAVEKLYEEETVEKKRVAARYAIDGPQAREFAADFFGLWLLDRTNDRFLFPSFINSFDTTYIHASRLNSSTSVLPTNKARRYSKNLTESASHPFFQDRIWAMKQFWNKLQTERTTLARASYFSNAASAAYIELHPERGFWDLSFVAGFTGIGKPMFSVDGQSVDAFLYAAPDAYNLYIGLNLSRFQWYSPWRYEAEVAYSNQKYGTTIGEGSSRRLLETLELRYLTAFPKITWSPRGGRNNRFTANRFSFFVSAGPTLRLPLGFNYQNYAVTVKPANIPSLQLSINPRVSLGIELMKKTFLPRGYKLAINYEAVGIRLNARPRPNAFSHNVDVTLHYSFARW